MDLIKNKNIKITKNTTTNTTKLTKKVNNITRNYTTPVIIVILIK